ncbi:nitrate- and nitrite sensing domain-containing protein [Actinoplanes sp. KI2]|uniref:sensor histidine kinase n=1 Tax=Actinoplanes sp. KI2 TaxID=2983315 RepID=UPI0021D56E80|nr:nitrate- and nitrite sensing domain-containing protein [Actinoplanes sp. KI2]MCU7722311.1 nitrate- and nitrite sensing domain-containing protein [Actinoplanes sp. KI2]
MLFGKFRILGKLALLVLVPLLGVVALSIPIIVTRINDARDAQKTSDSVELATRVSTAVQELQEERLLSIGFLFRQVQEPELVVQSAKATDAVARIDDGGQALNKDLRRAIRNVGRLDNTRQNVLNRAIRPDTLITEFTQAITPLINGLQLSSTADLKTGVGRQLFALDQALRTDDMISQASGYLVVATLSKEGRAGFVSLFYSTLVQLQQVIANAQTFFTDSQYKLYLGAQDAFSSRVGSDFLTEAAIDPNVAVSQLNIKTLFPSLRSVLVLGGFVEKRVAADVDTIVTNNRDTALRDAFLIGGGSLLLLLLVISLSIFMARAVARPLRRLTVSADRIARAAETELERVADDEEEAVHPIRLDLVDVEAQDEIGDLARAFDRVQTTAARLVERQVMGRRNVAQMFGHVGRRTQNLVGRQLALIDNLERKETDSDRLRELYRLDHMSSRLRRNASSLVVLSGGAGANEHMAPLSLSDVVRLALGEIEDYTRVDVEVPEDIMVVPAILADLTLMLAELMENATAFSPPHTRVLISATELRGGCRLAIVDNGLGMSPERLAEENARLTHRERLDLVPSEVLGLFVVGRLARRHDIEVTLTDTPGGGISVWIDLNPTHLISRVPSTTSMGAPPFVGAPATVPTYHTAEFAQVIAGSAARASVPGSQLPFDPNVFERATRTLESAHSWNAFTAPGRADAAPAIEAPYVEAGPVYDAEPVYSPAQIYQQPVGTAQVYQPPAGRDLGAPVAGRVPASLPELPAAGPSAWNQRSIDGPRKAQAPRPSETAWNVPESAEAAWNAPQPVEAAWNAPQPVEAAWNAPQPETPQPMWNTPEPEPTWNASAPAIPHQRTNEDHHYGAPESQEPERGAGTPLRRRVPGSQMPVETPRPMPTAPPSQDDAVAARAAFDAFEAGVSRAQWDAAETEMTAPPSAGHSPLARRVPGATLPRDAQNSPPPPAPAPPLDPDAARALMEQFEYGVALALNETQPEGQPR